MDIHNLKAFLAVARLGSFSEASEQLHLTQPAISKRIAGLEQQLGHKLFDRIGRNISLTEAGRELLPRATHILHAVNDTQQAIADLSGKISGPLSIATSHHIGLHRLPAVLRQFARDYPDVNLQLEFLDSEKAYAEVLQGHYDLAIITLAPDHDAKIAAVPIWSDPLSFVAAAEHPLAQQKNLRLQDFSPYPAILPDEKTYTTRLISQLFEKTASPLEISMTTNHLDTIKMMASIGLGWAVLPDTIIDQQLTKLKIPKLQVHRDLGCIYHRERSLSNAANGFLNVLEQHRN